MCAAPEGVDQPDADRLYRSLRDRDPAVRSEAATALAHLGDPRAVDALIQTLEDDVVGAGLSRSASTLAGLGPRVLSAVAPLLDSDEPSLRNQAMLVMREIAAERFNAGAKIGWPAELLRLMSAYEVDMARSERARLTRAVVFLLRDQRSAILAQT